MSGGCVEFPAQDRPEKALVRPHRTAGQPHDQPPALGGAVPRTDAGVLQRQAGGGQGVLHQAFPPARIDPRQQRPEPEVGNQPRLPDDAGSDVETVDGRDAAATRAQAFDKGLSAMAQRRHDADAGDRDVGIGQWRQSPRASIASRHQRRVVTSESHRVEQKIAGFGACVACESRQGQVAAGPGGLDVGDDGNVPRVLASQGRDHAQRRRDAVDVPEAGFRGRDRRQGSTAKHFVDGQTFRHVLLAMTGAAGADPGDIARLQTGAGQRLAHGPAETVTGWIVGDIVIGIGADAIGHQFPEDRGGALAGVGCGLQNQKGRAFAERHARRVAEGRTRVGGDQIQRFHAQSVQERLNLAAAGQHGVGLAGAQHVQRIAQGEGAAERGGAEGGLRTVQTVALGDQERLEIRGVAALV